MLLVTQALRVQSRVSVDQLWSELWRMRAIARRISGPGLVRNMGVCCATTAPCPARIHDFAIRRFHTLNARNYKRRLRTVMKMDGCFHPRWKHRFDVMGLVDLSHHASTARKLARLGHTAKTRHQKRPAETGGRNGASIAKFRTRRPAHICEISRYGAVFVRPSYLTRLRRTGWLGRRDSKLCISKSDLLNFIPPQRVLGVDRARL